MILHFVQMESEIPNQMKHNHNAKRQNLPHPTLPYATEVSMILLKAS